MVLEEIKEQSIHEFVVLTKFVRKICHICNKAYN